jgi:hypothetical protein
MLEYHDNASSVPIVSEPAHLTEAEQDRVNFEATKYAETRDQVRGLEGELRKQFITDATVNWPEGLNFRYAFRCIV